jgi:hypothetical protein
MYFIEVIKMDFEKWKETQTVKAKSLPTAEELEIEEFYSKCRKKINYGAGEISSIKLLILREEFENFKIFFSNLSDEAYQCAYCDDDF